MGGEKYHFGKSGPTHMVSVDWRRRDHRVTVIASLVKGVYVLECDRQNKRSLASPWWEFFNYEIIEKLIDDTDNSIFGAIFRLKPDSSFNGPTYIIAFRGSLIRMKKSVLRDFELDFKILKNGLHTSSRFRIAMGAVLEFVWSVGDHKKVWLAGHSLGSSIAALVGTKMAVNHMMLLETFLFNLPYPSVLEATIKSMKAKMVIRMTKTAVKAIDTYIKSSDHDNGQLSDDRLNRLATWIPHLFVNPGDYISSEYIGYYEMRKTFRSIDAGGIEKLALQHSEQHHLFPSVILTLNMQNPSLSDCCSFRAFKKAHGLNQWFRPDMVLQSTTHTYES